MPSAQVGVYYALLLKGGKVLPGGSAKEYKRQLKAIADTEAPTTGAAICGMGDGDEGDVTVAPPRGDVVVRIDADDDDEFMLSGGAAPPALVAPKAVAAAKKPRVKKAPVAGAAAKPGAVASPSSSSSSSSTSSSTSSSSSNSSSDSDVEVSGIAKKVWMNSGIPGAPLFKEDFFKPKAAAPYNRWLAQCVHHKKCIRKRSHAQSTHFGETEPIAYLLAWHDIGEHLSAADHSARHTKPTAASVKIWNGRSPSDVMSRLV